MQAYDEIMEVHAIFHETFLSKKKIMAVRNISNVAVADMFSQALIMLRRMSKETEGSVYRLT